MSKNKMGIAACSVIKKQIETAVMRDRKHFGSVATDFMCSAATKILEDEFNFDTEQINRFCEKLNFTADCLVEDYCSIEDLKTLANEIRGGNNNG